jgi:hypothetical protein
VNRRLCFGGGLAAICQIGKGTITAGSPGLIMAQGKKGDMRCQR